MARTPRARRAPPAPSDLIDPEAPPVGGARVDTPAYVAPSRPDAREAIPSDLVDVEAPPAGGDRVDTAAYASRAGRKRKSAAAPATSQVEAQAPPPPPEPRSQDQDPRTDPLDGEAGGAPPPAGPELGGAPQPLPHSGGVGEGDVVDRAADALLRLVGERPWGAIALRDVAQAAHAPFAELYAEAPSKAALMLQISRRMDREALDRLARDDAPTVRDRLFEAFMSRLEVMAPRREALLAAARAERVALAPALPRTVRALLEASGVDTSGWRGGLRLAAFTAVWGRVLAVWRDDEGALNRTMAEIDAQLTRALSRLERVRAGV